VALCRAAEEADQLLLCRPLENRLSELSAYQLSDHRRLCFVTVSLEISNEQFRFRRLPSKPCYSGRSGDRTLSSVLKDVTVRSDDTIHVWSWIGYYCPHYRSSLGPTDGSDVAPPD
jgi:hypothetical protein